MNDASDADKNHGLPSCYLDLLTANQLIIKDDVILYTMIYVWDNYKKNSEETYLMVVFIMN